jgi:hypothetical protein
MIRLFCSGFIAPSRDWLPHLLTGMILPQFIIVCSDIDFGDYQPFRFKMA